MSNVMTPVRLAALRRLRDAHGKDYDGCIADAYEMFLVVDECFRCGETEEVATWLPHTPDTELGDGECLFACDMGDEWQYSVECRMARTLFPELFERVRWYMPLPAQQLPAMKIQ